MEDIKLFPPDAEAPVHSKRDKSTILVFLQFYKEKLEYYRNTLVASANNAGMTKQLRGQIQHTARQIGVIRWLISVCQQRKVLDEDT